MDAEMVFYLVLWWLLMAVVAFGIRIAIERWFWRNKQ
jgi:hypothetical protein